MVCEHSGARRGLAEEAPPAEGSMPTAAFTTNVCVYRYGVRECFDAQTKLVQFTKVTSSLRELGDVARPGPKLSSHTFFSEGWSLRRAEIYGASSNTKV